MPKLVILVIVLGLLGYAGYYLMNNQSMPATQDVMMTQEESMTQEASSEGEMMEDSNTVTLAEQNASGQMGVATFTEENGKTKVRLEMKGSPEDVPQPAHIHTGSCPEVGAIAYPLTSVKDGTSETILDATLAEIAAKQPLGINVHKSPTEIKVYTACGDLHLSGHSAGMDR